MKPNSLSLLAAAALLGMPCLKARSGPDCPPPQDRPPGPPLPPLVLVAIDHDGDGIISAEEISKASETLPSLDKDKDGQLGKDEIRPKSPKGERDRPENGAHRHKELPPFPLLVVLDTNNDRELSVEEIAAAPAQLRTLDKNADGQLGPREYGPKNPAPRDDAPRADNPADGNSEQ